MASRQTNLHGAEDGCGHAEPQGEAKRKRSLIDSRRWTDAAVRATFSGNPMSVARRLSLPAFILAAFVAGAIGSSATFDSVRTWYPTLAKPSWNPPNWIFAPVWTTLYVLMGAAAWRAWRASSAEGQGGPVIRAYVAQLILNALWSILFFAWHRPDLALIDILALWLLLVSFLVYCWRRDRVAAWLWLPYVAWVSFATALNAAIWHLNR